MLLSSITAGSQKTAFGMKLTAAEDNDLYTTIYAGLEEELRKKSAATKTKPIEKAVQKQDSLRQQMSHLRLQIEQEQNEFDQKWSELGAEIAVGRKAHNNKLRKELAERENKSSSAVMKAVAKVTIPDQVMGSPLNNRQSESSRAVRYCEVGARFMSSEKIQAHEVAFEKIREITGISDMKSLWIVSLRQKRETSPRSNILATSTKSLKSWIRKSMKRDLRSSGSRGKELRQIHSAKKFYEVWNRSCIGRKCVLVNLMSDTRKLHKC